MLAYVVKRLLVLPITVIGVTLLVFVLVAASPGGLSGDEEPSGEMQAYIEDRYGLDDPIVVQYGRWLARVSPVVLGEASKLDRDGRAIRVPRAVRPPPAWRLYAHSLPVLDDGGEVRPGGRTADGASADERERAFRDALRAHEAARVLGFRARQELLAALREMARAMGVAEERGDGEWSAFERAASEFRGPERERVESLGRRALAAYAEAERSRMALARALDAAPLQSEGATLVPGVLSLRWPDLGDSLSQRRPVSELIGAALPTTLLLNLAAIPLTYLLAVPGGVLAAVRRGTWIDTGTSVLFTALWSVPTAWAAVMAVGFLSGAPPRGLGWFPVTGLHARDAVEMAFLPRVEGGVFERGYLLDTLWHMALPVLCLAYGSLAVLARQARSATLENLRADHVRTARAKGCDPPGILWRHVLRPGLLPMITLFVGVFPAMLSGSVIVERAFGIPGMGSLVVDSFLRRDAEVLLASTTMIAVVNVLALLLGDVLYAIADPRVRAGQGRAT